MKKFPLTPNAAALAARWKEAKDAETGWQEIRRNLEEQLSAEYGGFEALLAELEHTEALTTGVRIGDVLEATAGYDLKIDQVLATEFVRLHPELDGVLLKREYKPDSRKVCAILRGADTELKAGVVELASLKPKKIGFSKAK